MLGWNLENLQCDLKGSLEVFYSSVPHLQTAPRKWLTCPRSGHYLMAEQSCNHWPVLIWWLVIWCVRVIWAGGAGTRSQLCSMQSGSTGSPRGQVRGSAEGPPVHDQALLRYHLVFGHLTEEHCIRIKRSQPYPWLHFSPCSRGHTTSGALRYSFHTVSFFSPYFFEFWQMHIVMHRHHNQDRELSPHPRLPLCFLSKASLPWLPGPDHHYSIQFL